MATTEPTSLVMSAELVHVTGCFRTQGVTVTTWTWATGRTASEIAAADIDGRRFCFICNPLEVLRQHEENQ